MTPKALIILNRLIIFIIMGTILLTVVDFLRLHQEIDVNTRSWLNAGLGIEFDYYDLQELNNLDPRFELMGRFVQ